MDLGDAMARAAGWRETNTMERVKVTKQRTPTERNRDCPWSVGAMNLTELEADTIARFAEGIRSVNSPRRFGASSPVAGPPLQPNYDARINPATGDVWRCRNGHVLPTGTSWCTACDRADADRSQFLTGDWSVVNPEPTKPLTKTDEPGNRFSGLDLPPMPASDK